MADQLSDVWDAANQHTSIGYDKLGRKTSLSDPNMGNWSYAYDAAGNLVRQTDAKGQTTCSYYDGHSRLVGKTYRGDTACPSSATTYAVSYGYDDTPAAMRARGGAPARAQWVPIARAGSMMCRGRATSESRTVNGQTYTSGAGYDSADRVRTTTYPGDGEVVTTSYTRRDCRTA